jgi:hypothetical protein
MNKRLVWNFEIDLNHPYDFLQLPQVEREQFRWEARYFWPEKSTIILQGLDEAFMDLSLYDIKSRTDIYHLHPQHHYNVKERRNDLFYKPLIAQQNHCFAFGKKLNLSETFSADEQMPHLPWTQAEFLKHDQAESVKVVIQKVALKYSLPTTPATHLEFGWLRTMRGHFFTLCIEAKALILVEKMKEILLPGQISQDYVSFLRQELL